MEAVHGGSGEVTLGEGGCQQEIVLGVGNCPWVSWAARSSRLWNVLNMTRTSYGLTHSAARRDGIPMTHTVWVASSQNPTHRSLGRSTHLNTVPGWVSRCVHTARNREMRSGYWYRVGSGKMSHEGIMLRPYRVRIPPRLGRGIFGQGPGGWREHPGGKDPGPVRDGVEPVRSRGRGCPLDTGTRLYRGRNLRGCGGTCQP